MRPLVVVAALARVAHAEPDDDERLVHAGVIAALGGIYLGVELGIGAPASCRWCAAPRIDTSVRDSLRWGDTGAANTIGTVTGYALVPAATAGLVALGGWDGRWRHAYDDLVPIVEAGAATSVLQLAVKLATARRRPNGEDNESFFSGQTSADFALAVSAGVVASKRGYRVAPAVWASGLALAAASGYLRIASDRHYATDVATGAVAGALVGFVTPQIALHGAVVTPSGIAVVGIF